MSSRLLAIVTDPLEGVEAVEEIRRRGEDEGVTLRLIVPAVEESAFQHMLGDVDVASHQAEERLEASLAELGRYGVAAEGAIGDPDPVLAAQDALRREPADEVLIFERADGQARWFENGLLERARESLEPPLRMVILRSGDADGPHVVGVEEYGAGTAPDDEGDIEISSNMPPFAQGDLGGMVTGVVGTIVVVVLAAAGPGPQTTWGAVSILIAIGIALVNMAHVVGLTLFESVHYRGGWERFFRGLALVGTPVALVVNLLILLLA
jgi:hypothetical protein